MDDLIPTPGHLCDGCQRRVFRARVWHDRTLCATCDFDHALAETRGEYREALDRLGE